MDLSYVIGKAVKHYNWPIPKIPQFFDYFIDLYDELFNTKAVIENLISEIGDQDEIVYFDNLRNTRSKIIETVEESEAFKEFNDCKNPMFLSGKGENYVNFKMVFPYSKHTDVYKENNDGSYFVSIDMEAANFQSLQHYNKDILFGADTYEDFIRRFSDSKYLSGSKNTRQIIFGNLSAKRQNIMQRYHTNKIIEFVVNEGIMPVQDLRVYTADEMVFNAVSYMDESKAEEIKKKIYDAFGFKVHVESYRLKHIYKGAYAKEFENGKFKLKGVPSIQYAQIYKKYIGEPINKKDLVFLFEGEPAYFEKTINGDILV